MISTNAPSVLVGLIGSGIGGSLTPPMHEREGDMQGVRYLYRLIDLDELHLGAKNLSELLSAAEWMGFTGLNITYPCKSAVVDLLDELSEAAIRIGAVNTVVFSNGRRSGHNTDNWGFIQSFREEIASSCPYEKILLLGVGGAGTAIAHALLMSTDCNLEIFDIDSARLQALDRRLAEIYGRKRVAVASNIRDSVARSNGVINATPVGMNSHPGCPMDPRLLRSDLWVADIIYYPMETELVRAATKAGCTVMRGGGMAVYQAVRAFERFTGISPDVTRMKSHFNSLVNHTDLGPIRGGEAAV